MQTSLTLNGYRSMRNGKPYRTRNLKAIAAERAYKSKSGNYQAPLDVGVFFHSEFCDGGGCKCHRSFKPIELEKEPEND